MRCLAWLSPVCIAGKKAHTGKQLQQCLCVDYHTLNSLLPLVHSEVQDVLSLVPLPKIDELSALLNDCTVYSSLDCTSGHHYIAL